MVENRSSTLITSLIAGIVGALIVLGVQYAMRSGAPTLETKADLGPDVTAYLKSNPDAVIDSIKQYQANEQVKQEAEAKKVILQTKQELYNDPNSPVVGNPNGDVTLVEFFDYNCHYCRGVEPDVLKLQADDPKLRIVHKQLPILGPSSVEAAKVGLAIYKENPTAYVAYSKALLTHDGILAEADIEKAARDAGADWNQVLVDKESDVVKNEIKANYELAEKLNLTGTPGFVIGDNFMAGVQTETQLQDAVKAARASGWKVTAAPGATAPAAAPGSPSALPSAASPGNTANPAPESDNAPAASAPNASSEAAPSPAMPQDATKMPEEAPSSAPAAPPAK